ncbi:NAD-binding protein [Alphaproteobacteria bacterium HT1-32]|nr:NAD-binding protein [Alphaproteobacteria bacterium HT1-32]
MTENTSLAGRKVGFIGLGLMGKGMARNLHKAGAELFIHNRSQAAVEELTAEGMTAPGSPRAVAEAADIVIVCVTNTPAAEAVIEGPDGALSGLSSGKILIDMGTTTVTAARRFATSGAANGVIVLDAPVSGGQQGAEAGSLTIMAGGDADGFASALPVLQAMGAHITLVGDSGAGQIAKAANQIIVGLTIGAVSEAMGFAKAAGVDPGRVRDAIRGGFAESRILDVHGKRMAEGDFVPGGRCTVQEKDLRQALEFAESCGRDLPVTELVRDLYLKLMDLGDGDLDHAALYRLYDGTHS